MVECCVNRAYDSASWLDMSLSFFFSSRRRHTRCSRDWSSDVCSSDLSQVFGGFSGQACGSRIQDSGSRVLITMDGYWRNGSLVDHKANADIAVKTAKDLGQGVDKVLVGQR